MKFEVVKSKPHFSVSREGLIMNTKTGNILSSYYDRDGYKRTAANLNGKTTHIACHRAVAEVFVPNPNPEKYTIVNHINSIKDDNRPENLEWVDWKINRQHCQVTGNHNNKGSRHSQAKLTEKQVVDICKRLQRGERVVDISKDCGVKRYTIQAIKSGNSWVHISKDYPICTKRKDTVSKATIDWVEYNYQQGKTDKEILEIATKLDKIKLQKIKNILKIV